MAAGGKLKILGVGGKERLRLMPDIPTLDEAGVPGYELTGKFGMVAPARTPQLVLERLTQEVRQAVRERVQRTHDCPGIGYCRQLIGGDDGADAGGSRKWVEVINKTGARSTQ